VDGEISAGILPRGGVGLLREARLAGELERGRSADLACSRPSSTTPKGPVRLGFPIDVLERWQPNLYPGDVISNKATRAEEPSDEGQVTVSSAIRFGDAVGLSV
jgi:hypothetical protein